MIYVWLQSIVILSLVFSGGLWLGGSLSNWMGKPAAHETHRIDLSPPAEALPAFIDLASELAPAAIPEPEPETVPLPFVAEPAPAPTAPVPVPVPVKRWPLLYPTNQFGTISVTRAPA